LGKAGFGKVVLAKEKLPGGPEERYAIKALKKQSITSISISQIFAENEALILSLVIHSSQHFTRFQNRVRLNF